MRVLIAGGSGLIGRALTNYLVSAGNDVTVLSRRPNRIVGLPAGAKVEPWDARTAEGWGSLVERVDAIVNLAGENISSGRWTRRRKRSIRESRLDAGRAIVEAVQAVSRKPRVIVQASAVGYYGDCGDEELTEESPQGDDFLARVTGEWEASTSALEASGIRRVIVRTGVVLSDKGGALCRMLLPFRLFVGGPLGSSSQWFPWIHIADEVAGIRFLMENENAAGPYNLTAPFPVTNAEFAHYLGQTLGTPAAIRTPALALRLLFGEMASVLLASQRVIPQRLQQLGFDFRFPEVRLALKDILKGKPK